MSRPKQLRKKKDGRIFTYFDALAERPDMEPWPPCSYTKPPPNPSDEIRPYVDRTVVKVIQSKTGLKFDEKTTEALDSALSFFQARLKPTMTRK